MKRKKQFSLLFAVVLAFGIYTADADPSYCFRIYLKDKGVTDASLADPSQFLSAEAIARREKRLTDITLTDVPIAASQIAAIAAENVRIVTQSKWMGTVVVESSDSLIFNKLKALPTVDSVLLVWRGEDRLKSRNCTENTVQLTPSAEKMSDDYGYSREQIEMLNGIKLHDLGKRGQGMRIAVIDAGFLNVNKIAAFSSLNLIGTHNVVFPDGDVYCDDEHGTKVLSCLAANLPGLMVGTAPEASYLLIKSEDPRAEYPIEEDFWAAALEYADSVGVDIVSSSLGYSKFDLIDTIYRTADLDGKTAFISQVADIAEEKGMLLFVSAGNEGNQTWQKITFPADAADILTVGSINGQGEHSSFSSTGFTADLRVKPDIVALGSYTTVIDSSGNIAHSNGTSFATPIAAGLGACLWQACSWLNNKEIIQLIRSTASQANRPDVEQGYGVPDFYKAYQKELNGPVQ